MGAVQKIRVAKTKTNKEGQYKTLYKVYSEYGEFLYYQVGADGMITEFIDDLKENGYLFYDYKFNPLRSIN